MSGNPEELKNFNLGLPDFEAAPTIPNPNSQPTAPIPNSQPSAPIARTGASELESAAEALAPVPKSLVATVDTAVDTTDSPSDGETLDAMDLVPIPKPKPIPAPAKKAAAKQPTAAATPAASSTPVATKSKGADKNSNGSVVAPKSPYGRSVVSGVPSWLVSLFVHVAILLVLGAWNFEPIKQELKMMLVSSENVGESDALEEFAFEESASSELQTNDPQDSPVDMPVVDSVATDASVSVAYSDVIAPSVSSVSMPSVTQNLTPRGGIAAQSGAAMKASLSSRSKETKRDLLKKFGGSTETEVAVSRSLKWLAMHQNPETGAWNFAHSFFCNGQCDKAGNRRFSQNAATGLALMCFLGAGQTHMEGEYKETVFKGLSYLLDSIKVQKGYGAWYNKTGDINDDMYSHGIATIAICEAYGMTKDARLAVPAQLGVNYLGFSQNQSTGGWHYDPNGQGDTSIVGWQMMALKSAAMSNLTIDIDVVRKGNVFLDLASSSDGTYYHYDLNGKQTNAGYNPATTACGFLCRMYSGMHKDHPSLVSAVKRFSADGPNFGDIYYNYYATQVLKQVGGPEWESWNVRMRDHLLTTQVKSGHATGSWYWEDKIGHNEGGRLYLTCMATMILEVYYRYMPLYAEQAEEDSFKL